MFKTKQLSVLLVPKWKNVQLVWIGELVGVNMTLSKKIDDFHYINKIFDGIEVPGNRESLYMQ